MSKFGDESILTQCYWTWETESKIVSFRKERQQPYSLEMEGGVGGIIFSRTVRPEILTQSCDNADLRILQIYSCISASTPNLLSSLQKWTLNITEYEQMNILNLNWSKFILMVTLSSLLSSYPKNFSWAGKTGWVYYDTHWKKKLHWIHIWSFMEPLTFSLGLQPPNRLQVLPVSLLPYRAAVPDSYSSLVMFSPCM